MIPEWECPTVLAESNTPTPPQTLIHKDVPANTEYWDIGCNITVDLTQAMIPTWNRLQV